MIANVLPYLIGISLFSVIAVLALGLVSMVRGGDFNKKYGNRLMQARIATQAITVLLLVLFFFVREG